MYMRFVGKILILIMLSGCASAPKFRYVDRYDPIVDQNNSVALFVDVCNQIDVVGVGDYCIIDESKKSAYEVVEKIMAYLTLNGISVGVKIIPFVCGALDSPENLPVRAAKNTINEVIEAPKPFAIADEIKEDPEYVNSLVTLSTYVFERNIIKYLEDSGETERLALIINEDQFKEAVKIVKERKNVSRLLYIGIKGKKLSSGKKFGQGLASFAVGMATGMATMGVISHGNTEYGIFFIPGGNTDGAFSTAGLIDIEKEKLSWQNYSSNRGDPIEIKNVASSQHIGLLLNDLFFVKESIQ